MIADVYTVLDLIELPMVKAGSKEVRAKCPAHEERTGKRNSIGDFYINVETGKSQCFSCEFKSASIMTLGAYVTGLDLWSVMKMFMEADVIDLRQLAVVNANDRRETEKRVEEPSISEAELVLFEEVPDHMLELRYLTREAADAYGVRWDGERKAWVLPLYDTNDRFKGYQLRKKGWERNQPEGLAKARLLFGSRVLHQDADAPIVVTESPLDALRAWQVGYVGLSTLGAGFSDEQAEYLIESDRVVIAAFDQDTEGEKAARRLFNDYGRRFGGRLRFAQYCTTHKDIGDMPNETLVASTLDRTSALVVSL